MILTCENDFLTSAIRNFVAPLPVPAFSHYTTVSNIANVALQLSIDGFTVDAIFDVSIVRLFEWSTFCGMICDAL